MAYMHTWLVFVAGKQSVVGLSFVPGHHRVAFVKFAVEVCKILLCPGHVALAKYYMWRHE